MKIPSVILSALFCLTILVAIIPLSTVAIYRDEPPNYTAWTTTPPNVEVGWISDKTIGTQKGAIPLFHMFWSNHDEKQVITFKTTIQGYNSTWASGWAIDTLTSSNPSDAFSTQPPDTEGGKGTHGTYTDSFYYTAPKMEPYSGRGWAIFIQVPTNAKQTSITIECNITDSGQVTCTDYATLGIQTNDTYNIVMVADKLQERVDPEEVINHPFNIVNLGQQDNIDVILNYEIAVKDPDGKTVTNTGWTVVFYDYYGRKITLYKDIPRLGTVHPSITLTAPEREDGPPAESTVTITITGHVVNDTRYKDTMKLGGDDIKLSDKFEFDGGEGRAWYQPFGGWYDGLFWGVIVIIAGTLFMLYFSSSKFIRKRR